MPAFLHNSSLLIAEVSPATLFVLGMLVIGVVLLRRSRLLRRGACKTNLAGKTLGERAALAQTPPALTQWEVNMHETARDLSGQLDSKIVILQHLIADATRATERLEAAVAAMRDASSRPGSTAEGLASDVAYQDWPTPRLSEPGSELEWLERRGEQDAHAAHAQIPEARRQQILTLAAGGYTRAAISNQVGVPLGDVDLVLSLQ